MTRGHTLQAMLPRGTGADVPGEPTRTHQAPPARRPQQLSLVSRSTPAVWGVQSRGIKHLGPWSAINSSMCVFRCRPMWGHRLDRR